jgi:hypothetical protein
MRLWSRFRIVSLAGVLLASLLAGQPAGAEETDGKIEWGTMDSHEFRTGTFIMGSGAPLPWPCTASVTPWVTEVQKSGIQRMRLHFELYGAYTPLGLPSQRSSNQVVYPQGGAEFADDDRSFYIAAALPWGLWKEERGERIVADFVGERPSFWNPDVHHELELGAIDCDTSEMVNCLTYNNCAVNVEPDDGVTGGGAVVGGADTDQDGIPNNEDTDQGFCIDTFTCTPGRGVTPPSFGEGGRM